MTASIGHNNPPKDRTFKKRWASAIFDCEDPKKPVGAVAMAFRIYHDMDGSGFGVAASDLEIAQACGVSDRSVRTFKAWLVNAGFIRILSKGGRGGLSEYRALIPDEIELPEKSAGETEIKPEAISGKKQLNRKTLPEKENGFPEKISGGVNQPEKSAGEPKTSPAPARAYIDNNIYNNTNNIKQNTPSLTEQVSSREGDGKGLDLRPGEEHIGHGVIVNCETVRHRDFTISLKAIEFQLVGALPMDRIKAVAVGQALQWAVEIESGKPAHKVVPDKPANFIRGSLQNQHRNDMLAEVKRDSMKPKGPKLSRWAQ